MRTRRDRHRPGPNRPPFPVKHRQQSAFLLRARPASSWWPTRRAASARPPARSTWRQRWRSAACPCCSSIWTRKAMPRQRSASSIPPARPGSYEVVIGGETMADLVVDSPEAAGLRVLPATIDLAGAEIELVSMVATGEPAAAGPHGVPGGQLLRLRLPGLPALPRAAHPQCPRCGQRDPDPHPVRVLRAGGRLPADAHHQPGQGRAERRSPAEHRAAHHVRRPDTPVRPGGAGGADSLRRRDPAGGDSAIGANLGGAELRPDRADLPPRLRRRGVLSAGRPRDRPPGRERRPHDHHDRTPRARPGARRAVPADGSRTPSHRRPRRTRAAPAHRRRLRAFRSA